MSTPSTFARGLSDGFVRELLHGSAGTILHACRAAGLDVRIREDYLNAYDEGRSVANLSWGPRRGVALRIHRKYLPLAILGDVAGASDAEYLSFAVDAALAAAFVAVLPEIRREAGGHCGDEERIEALIARANANGTQLVVLDRQVAFPGQHGRLDVAAVDTTGARPRLVAVEIKQGLDNRIQDVPEQAARYVRLLDPEGRGLRADVAAAWRTTCAQMQALGLQGPSPSLVTAGMTVVGLVVLANYNARSELLARAHAAAASLPHPVYLCEVDARGLLPPPGEWVRFGTTDASLAPGTPG